VLNTRFPNLKSLTIPENDTIWRLRGSGAHSIEVTCCMMYSYIILCVCANFAFGFQIDGH
jgi:hypothetical protein